MAVMKKPVSLSESDQVQQEKIVAKSLFFDKISTKS